MEEVASGELDDEEALIGIAVVSTACGPNPGRWLIIGCCQKRRLSPVLAV